MWIWSSFWEGAKTTHSDEAQGTWTCQWTTCNWNPSKQERVTRVVGLTHLSALQHSRGYLPELRGPLLFWPPVWGWRRSWWWCCCCKWNTLYLHKHGVLWLQTWTLLWMLYSRQARREWLLWLWICLGCGLHNFQPSQIPKLKAFKMKYLICKTFKQNWCIRKMISIDHGAPSSLFIWFVCFIAFICVQVLLHCIVSYFLCYLLYCI